jgi:hypothetical protein
MARVYSVDARGVVREVSLFGSSWQEDVAEAAICQ